MQQKKEKFRPMSKKKKGKTLVFLSCNVLTQFKRSGLHTVFSHSVMAVMLVPQTNPMEAEFFCYVNNFFRSNTVAWLLTTWVTKYYLLIRKFFLTFQRSFLHYGDATGSECDWFSQESPRTESINTNLMLVVPQNCRAFSAPSAASAKQYNI